MEFAQLARSLNAEVDTTAKKPRFTAPCPICGAALIFKQLGGAAPTLIRSCECGEAAIWSAIERLQARSRTSTTDREAGEAHHSPAIPAANRSSTKELSKSSTSRSYTPAVSESDPLRRLPPQNIEAEQAVLGSIFYDNEALPVAKTLLQASDFYRETHRIIFQAMCDLTSGGRPIDKVTLGQLLKSKGFLDQIGGAAYIIELVEGVPTAANIAHYSAIVKDMAVKRSVASHAQELISMANNGVSADALVGEMQRRAALLDQNDASSGLFSQGIQVFTGQDILHRRRTKTANQVVVDGFLHRKEVSLWAGKVEAGKTTMLRELCIDVIRGEPFLGRACVKSRVLYLMLDADGEELTIKEFERSGWEPDRDTELRFIFEPAFAAKPRAMAELRKTLTAFEPALVIIDPLGRFMQVKDFNDYATTYVMATISELAKQFDCHVAMPHHIPRGRNDEADAGTAGLGSIVIGGSVNNRFVLTRKPGDVYTIKTSKGKGSGFVPFEGEQVVKRDPETGRIELAGDYSWKDQAKALMDQIQRIIDASEEPITAQELAMRAGIQRSAAASAAQMLYAEKRPEFRRVDREGKGKAGSPFKFKKLLQSSLPNGNTPDN